MKKHRDELVIPYKLIEVGRLFGRRVEPDWKTKECKQIDLWFCQRQIDWLICQG